jgi:hypothetical protein
VNYSFVMFPSSKQQSTGVQDAVSAADGAFVLVDGRLTLKEIMKQPFSHPELAVLRLSTAKGLPEEAIHLVNRPVRLRGVILIHMTLALYII